MSDTGADARVLATERNAARVRPQRGIADLVRVALAIPAAC